MQPWNNLIRKLATAPSVGASFRQDLHARLDEKLRGTATIRRVHIGGRDRSQVRHRPASQIPCSLKSCASRMSGSAEKNLGTVGCSWTIWVGLFIIRTSGENLDFDTVDHFQVAAQSLELYVSQQVDQEDLWQCVRHALWALRKHVAGQYPPGVPLWSGGPESRLCVMIGERASVRDPEIA